MTAREGFATIFPGVSTRIEGFEGIFPGPTILAEEGQRCMLLLLNRLGHRVVNHLHGGNTPPGSDGFPMDFIEPMEANWAAPDQRNTEPGTKGPGWQAFDYSNQQTGTLLWYHDHTMDRTGYQIWKGLVGTYLLRGRDEAALRLPADDRELVLVLTDRSFDEHGQFLYPTTAGQMGSGEKMAEPVMDPTVMGGALGDVMLVNGVPWPVHRVATGRYRLRLLNASNARHYTLALDRTLPVGYQFLQIGSDGGLLGKPLLRKQIQLAPAERVDLLVDFSGCRVGTAIHLVNAAEDGAMHQMMRFLPTLAVTERVPLPTVLSQNSAPTSARGGLVERTFEFKYSRIKKEWTVNGLTYDPDYVMARPALDTTEIWHLRSDFTHPVHLHLVHFAVLSHAGRPELADQGWKDTVALTAGQTASILIPFRGHKGKYVFHCHNLEHEDMRMMANFEVI